MVSLGDGGMLLKRILEGFQSQINIKSYPFHLFYKLVHHLLPFVNSNFIIPLFLPIKIYSYNNFMGSSYYSTKIIRKNTIYGVLKKQKISTFIMERSLWMIWD